MHKFVCSRKHLKIIRYPKKADLKQNQVGFFGVTDNYFLFTVGERTGVDANELEDRLAGVVDESDSVVALGKSFFGFFKRYEHCSLCGDVGTHHASGSHVGELHGVGHVGVDRDFAVDDVAAGIAVDFLFGEVEHKLYALVGVWLAVDGSHTPCSVEEVHVVLAEHHHEMSAVIEQIEIRLVAVARYLVGADLVESGVDEMFERGVGAIFLRRHHAGEAEKIAFAGDSATVDDVAAIVAVDTSLGEVKGYEGALLACDFLTVYVVDVPLAVETNVGERGGVIFDFFLDYGFDSFNGRSLRLRFRLFLFGRGRRSAAQESCGECHISNCFLVHNK